MLGKKLTQTRNTCTARQLIQRTVPLAQRDDLLAVVEAGQEFTETPNAAFVDRKSRGPALAPESPERAVIDSRAPTGINDFQQVAATGAAKVRRGFCTHHAAANAPQFGAIGLG